MKSSPLFLLCSVLFSLITVISSAIDSINTTHSIRDGETLVSAGGSFELGFFSPGASKNRYVGIWYKKISTFTVVWVANRETPLLDSSGVLTVTFNGSLVLLNRTSGVAWSSNSSKPVHNPIAQLQESGNFVVRGGGSEDPEKFLWQSFDHPCDTLLPGMKLGVNKVSGQNWYLSSWKSDDDPSPGEFAIGVDPHRFSQLVLTKNSAVQSQSGPWNGLGYNGEPELKTNPYLKFDFVYNQEEIYYSYRVRDSSVTSRLLFSVAGMLQRYIWFNGTQGWVLYTTVVMDNCYRYGVCGPYGSCNGNNFPLCGCLKGFQPKYRKDSDMADWAKGCIRETPVECGRREAFKKYSGLKLPDTEHFWYNGNMSLGDCWMVCLRNCSCSAYTNSDVRGGRGCLIWFGDLLDMRVTTDYPQDIYIRMAASELDELDRLNSNADSHTKKRMKIISSSVAVSIMVLLGLVIALFFCWKKHQQPGDGSEEDLGLPFFDFSTVAIATDNFSFQNKLGEGGFGPVYKGILKDGQEVAVKRLSRSSKQGLDEFKNEVIHIAKLQHRNLVKLLGYCIKLNEKMLVYEHVANNSLDSLIFGLNLLKP